MPVVVLLTVAGLQVPVIPFVEVVGNVGGTAPLQIGAIALKVGKTEGLTVTISVEEEAHCPIAGVNI